MKTEESKTIRRRWKLKKLISNMVERDFNYWYYEIISNYQLPTAEELVEEEEMKWKKN